ncbi:MAG: NAD-dependent epimerase/dehydratase family protein [Verrucomicrobiota bacterium]
MTESQAKTKSPPAEPAKLLIAGCGFLGSEIARQAQAEGWEVEGLVHRPETAEELRNLLGIPILVGDLGDRESLRPLAETRQGLDLIHCASSGRGGAEAYERVYLHGTRHLLELFSPRKLLFTGSSSVYGQTDGSWVTEESPAEPTRKTGRLLLAAEQATLCHPLGIVARLAGLYGPGRSVILKKFLRGEAILEEGGYRYLNQIHRDDAAAACLHLLERGQPGLVNVCDSQPLTQRECYGFLAEHFQKPLPREGPRDLNRKRGWSHKRISNQKLQQAGFQARFHDFREAILNDPRMRAKAS